MGSEIDLVRQHCEAGRPWCNDSLRERVRALTNSEQASSQAIKRRGGPDGVRVCFDGGREAAIALAACEAEEWLWELGYAIWVDAAGDDLLLECVLDDDAEKVVVTEPTKLRALYAACEAVEGGG